MLNLPFLVWSVLEGKMHLYFTGVLSLQIISWSVKTGLITTLLKFQTLSLLLMMGLPPIYTPHLLNKCIIFIWRTSSGYTKGKCKCCKILWVSDMAKCGVLTGGSREQVLFCPWEKDRYKRCRNFYSFTVHTVKYFTAQNKLTSHLQFVFFMFAFLIYLTTTLKYTRAFL